jgi:hypothetical protein
MGIYESFKIVYTGLDYNITIQKESNRHMLKPTANYKMSKSGKRALAQYIDPHERGSAKRAIIDAELSAAQAPKREPKSKKPSFGDVEASE